MRRRGELNGAVADISHGVRQGSEGMWNSATQVFVDFVFVLVRDG